MILVALVILSTTQLTVFVVQPIGAIPEGRTLIISRLNKLKLIDSADAVCEREQGNVNLICRAAVMGAVGKNAVIYLRLPYSEWLYTFSTGGKTYER